MLRLYDFHESGNGYKVRLLLHDLGVPFERVEVDVLRGETRTPEFLAKNPNGRIPLLEWRDGRRLAESNAICWHLAEGSAWIPDDAFARAQVLQWMFFEQYSHEPYVAVLRFWRFAGRVPADPERVAEKEAGGYAALAVMERHLEGRAWLVGEAPTLADLALYAYTHVAEEGGLALGRFPAVGAWLARFTARPRHVPITKTTFP
ncbi:MAG: glutathione S-transferase family protein [Myxococcota bacterium]|nr:glutathione S-transferase family protein [Myxococcota bacterium]